MSNSSHITNLRLLIYALQYEDNYFELITAFRELPITYTKLNHLDIFVNEIKDLTPKKLDNSKKNINVLINGYKNKKIIFYDVDKVEKEINYGLNLLFSEENEVNLITFEKIINDEIEHRKLMECIGK